MAKISRIWAREILDSRGTPTIEAYCLLDNGAFSVTSVPSGASVGKHEAIEMRDQDPDRYKGKGVLKAVEAINNVVGPAIVQMQIEPFEQIRIDSRLLEMDGTKDKSKFGANSLLAVSAAVCKAGAISRGKRLYAWIQELSAQLGMAVQFAVPPPIFNMINGGLHGAGNLDFQEFFVIPASTKSFSEGLRMGVEVYQMIGSSLARRGAIHSVGDEGGYAPNLFTNADALEILVEAIKLTQYQLGRDVFLGLDVAANTVYKNDAYVIRDKSAPLGENQMIEYYNEINDLYHLAVLEDPLYEDAWAGWSKLSKVLGGQLAVVGDDLLSTNSERVQKAVQTGACNSILVKPNQVGTVTETIKIIKQSKDAKWKVVVSHRSGETNDSFIADLAVGVGADYVKFGAPARGERVAKYNRLSAIEIELQYMAGAQQQNEAIAQVAT